MNVDRESLARAVGSGVSEERVAAWEDGTAQPTLRQLEKMAGKLLRDPAFFIGDGLPEDESALASFRRAFGAPEAAPSYELLRAVAEARARRDDLLDLWDEAGVELPERRLHLDARKGVIDAAERIRTWSGLCWDDQARVASDYALLSAWIDAVESQGVLVSHASHVDVAEFRGLAMDLRPAPIVLLNGGDAVAARAFTLLHEVCHLGLGHNDWSQAPISAAASDDRTEQFCNGVAAELLMPESEVARCVADMGDIDERGVAALARGFNVSRAVAAVRLAQLGRIEREVLRAILVAARSATSRRSSGGSFYRTQVHNVGRRYTAEVLEAMYAGRITRHHAASMLGTRKAAGVDAMRDALAGARQ